MVILTVLLLAAVAGCGGTDATVTNSVVTKNRGVPTTANFTSLLKERCMSKLNASQKCDGLVDSFVKSTLSHQPCKLYPSAYEAFVNESMTSPPRDKVTFWTGVYDHIVQYSAKLGYFSLEATLPGYMLNGLHWCGKEDGSDFDYTSCPESKDCKGSHVEYSFWTAASAKFARLARGKVRVLVTSVRIPAMRRGMLRTVELPNLDSHEVGCVDVMMVTPEGQSARQNCHSDSVIEFGKAVQQRGILYGCRGPMEAKVFDLASTPEQVNAHIIDRYPVYSSASWPSSGCFGWLWRFVIIYCVYFAGAC